MTPILQQFLSESRDFLEAIAAKLIELEDAPADVALMGDLFRQVHTLKGNSGLFDFPEMTRVLHAAEDLMSAVREGKLAYSNALADCLLPAMDFVGVLLDEIEATGTSSALHAGASAELARTLRAAMPGAPAAEPPPAGALPGPDAPESDADAGALHARLAGIAEASRMAWYENGLHAPLHWLRYSPEPDCFFKGEDPFFVARQVPGLLWQRLDNGAPPETLAEFDAFRCTLRIEMIADASAAELADHFRYVPEQVRIEPIAPRQLVIPLGHDDGGPVLGDFLCDARIHLAGGDIDALARAAASLLELSAPGLRAASALRWLLLMIEAGDTEAGALGAVLDSIDPQQALRPAGAALAAPAGADQAGAVARGVLATQLMVLEAPDAMPSLGGRLRGVGATVRACLASLGQPAAAVQMEAALAEALALGDASPLRRWLVQFGNASEQANPVASPARPAPLPADGEPQSGRRADEAAAGPRTLKVDQEKIDRLMGLIGEMVVAKNALPYLAAKAETEYGQRELARDIKSQYAVINRIAEEMQDSIMQVRMMPVSFVFQRFPRLVRDIARKLGKEVQLVLEGEATEADKNIIEALADPLIHIVRNSLDHGLETPAERIAAGKSPEGRLLICALQEADRVVIDIIDDGKGIDPAVIKRKALEKGVIDQALFERISDADAIQLVFAPGFSTAEVVSDLSGRGVGMDVVRAAVEQVKGHVRLESEVGRGTRLRLSLPLSMAVTSVMIIESAGQLFGIPMSMVRETVRVPRDAIHTIKTHEATLLRGQIVPMRSLNRLLACATAQRPNEAGELAMLVIRLHNESVGLVVDDFREVVDVILKPMGGILASLSAYAGSALLGNGSVLMVLNPKELV